VRTIHALVERGRPIRAGVGIGLRIGRRHASADYSAGTNELPVQVALADLLRPGDVFFDVGANVGFFSLVAARLVGPEGRVIAIEPVPANCKAIRANARRNGFRNVEVLAAAAGGVEGTATLVLTRHPGGAALATAASQPPDAVGQLRVRVATIDGLVEAGHWPAPNVVKIDVEGAETGVLEGMCRTLARWHPVILCEVDGPDDAELAARRRTVVDLLAGWGYTVTELVDSYPGMTWRVCHFIARFDVSP
jgi:FkbM family methyltransferase